MWLIHIFTSRSLSTEIHTRPLWLDLTYSTLMPRINWIWTDPIEAVEGRSYSMVFFLKWKTTGIFYEKMPVNNKKWPKWWEFCFLFMRKNLFICFVPEVYFYIIVPHKRMRISITGRPTAIQPPCLLKAAWRKKSSTKWEDTIWNIFSLLHFDMNSHNFDHFLSLSAIFFYRGHIDHLTFSKLTILFYVFCMQLLYLGSVVYAPCLALSTGKLV